MSDAGKLEALFESLSKQQICGDLVQEDGYKWAAMGNLLVAYTSDALLILGDPNGGVPQDLCHMPRCCFAKVKKTDTVLHRISSVLKAEKEILWL